MLVFDLVKAFLQIELPESDRYRLCFLWFKDVPRSDFTIVGYYFNRSPFGLKCSPFLLMIGLYFILMGNSTGDEEIDALKKSIWDLMYVDNGAVTARKSENLVWAFDQVQSIFTPYKFELQQYETNDAVLNEHINKDKSLLSVKTDHIEPAKLFGINWDSHLDWLMLDKLCLNKEANCKRQVLQSIALNYDPIGMALPLLNRAKLFLHRLKNIKSLNWDTKLSPDDQKIWYNICDQINRVPQIAIDRFVGGREEEYELLAFTDSSQQIYGVVLFLLNKASRRVSFLQARNRLVSNNLKTKSIPSLELQAALFGVENLISIYEELSGNDAVRPINVSHLHLFTDSLVVLNWIKSNSIKFDKMNKLSIFVKNRLNSIAELCERKAVTFRFCEGSGNPADMVTRPLSYKQLHRTNYFSGISYDTLLEMETSGHLILTVPRILGSSIDTQACTSIKTYLELSNDPMIDPTRYSSSYKCVEVAFLVLKFLDKLKRKANEKYGRKLNVSNENDLRKSALIHIIRQDQMKHFADIHNYFDCSEKALKNIPTLVSQLNVYKDENSLLRVKAKFKTWNGKNEFPVLLSKHSKVARLLVLDMHHSLSHGGIHRVITEFRKLYWVPAILSFVKKVLKDCILCRKVNSRPISLNQSSYRDFRLMPCNIPFRDLFLDYIGPFTVYNSIKLKLKCIC